MSAIKRVYEFKEEVDELNSRQLENFVYDIILNTNKFQLIKRRNLEKDFGYDFYAEEKTFDGKLIKWLIEVKKSELISVDIVRFLNILLKETEKSFSEGAEANYKLLIISPSSYTAEARFFAKQNNIDLWSIYDLYLNASEELQKKYFYSQYVEDFDLNNEDYYNNDNTDQITDEEDTFAILSDKPSLPFDNIKPKVLNLPIINNDKDYFIKLLKSIKPGKEEWSKYQKAISDIFEYLFESDLGTPIYENSDEESRNRRDIIMENICYDGFWNLIRSIYNAHYIVVDAKNYTKEIKKGPVTDIAHYLKPHGCGMFGILVTRLGSSQAADHAIRETWISDHKMIVVLSDDDILAMLDIKSNFGKPEELIRQKISNFRLSL